ncbi:MAG: hypothetical protein JST92_07690 [Deltaproteobacteria bacterium]|nr:hypothetical protein [Deltaproteobacteria bacterium]
MAAPVDDDTKRAAILGDKGAFQLSLSSEWNTANRAALERSRRIAELIERVQAATTSTVPSALVEEEKTPTPQQSDVDVLVRLIQRWAAAIASAGQALLDPAASKQPASPPPPEEMVNLCAIFGLETCTTSELLSVARSLQHSRRLARRLGLPLADEFHWSAGGELGASYSNVDVYPDRTLQAATKSSFDKFTLHFGAIERLYSRSYSPELLSSSARATVVLTFRESFDYVGDEKVAKARRCTNLPTTDAGVSGQACDDVFYAKAPYKSQLTGTVQGAVTIQLPFTVAAGKSTTASPKGADKSGTSKGGGDDGSAALYAPGLEFSTAYKRLLTYDKVVDFRALLFLAGGDVLKARSGLGVSWSMPVHPDPGDNKVQDFSVFAFVAADFDVGY